MALYNDVNFYSSSSFSGLPQQMIPLKEKLAKAKEGEKSFGQKCMDALEIVGKQQYASNIRLIENYEMIKGRFIFKDYFETDGYDSSLSKLSAEFELPNYLRHYDIISPVINTMSGEYQKRPDIFKVRQMGEAATNEYLRTKKDLLTKYVMSKLNAEINMRLLDEGIDPEKDDFVSEEEAQQYQQQIDQYKQQLTPPEIQKFLNTDFATVAELWAEHERQYSREYFNLPEKEKVEFEDMLVADRCYRHFYITPYGVGWNQETWNPVNTFMHKSPDIQKVEDGDYAGRIFYISINTILDRYGYLMSKDDFDLLSGEKDRKKTKFSDSKFDWVYDNYLVPFEGYPAYDIMRSSWNVSPGSAGQIPQVDSNFLNGIGNQSYYAKNAGLYCVTEGYWMSQKKIIKITYVDQESQEIVVSLVDENFIMPDEFVESKNIFSDNHDINTYVSTYVPECWRGIKISAGSSQNLSKDIYVGIGPNEFQFKGENNIYGSKLPVCGESFSTRNSESMSLVDMMKPHQIGYNISMNQLYQLAEKEIGMFVVMDVNMFPDAKDWGGEDAWGKWMMMAKNYGMLPADTSPTNIKQSLAATGGFLPKVINLDLASQMVSRMNMAKFYEEQAMKQVGFNSYRLGSFAQSSTATGIQQGMAQSYSQTESYFTNFSNYLRRCTTMGLEMAQYVQSANPNISFTYTKGDMSKALIQTTGVDIMLAELGIIVSNSQEYMRQLEMIRQYALSNNTSGMSGVDVADVIMMNSPQEIRRQLQVSYDKVMQQQQSQQQAQQQQAEQANQIAALNLQQQDAQFREALENKLDVARINAGADLLKSETDLQPQDNTSAELNATVNRQNNMDASTIKREELALKRQAQLIDLDLKQRELTIKQNKINADIQIQKQETESARILKGKATKK